MKTTHCGMFDSERFWRPQELMTLPGVRDINAMSIVENMDELFFLFCKKGDILLTKRKFNEPFKEYLYKMNFDFSTINMLESDYDNIFRDTKFDESECEKIRNTRLSFFAAVPYMREMAEKYSMDYDAPSIENIAKVNSKIYSNKMNERLSLKRYGYKIYTLEELKYRGGLLLKNGKIILKDIFGVSGKGNLIVSSESMLDRIIRYYKMQMSSYNQRLSLIVEPLLDKKIDFSCQLYIEKDGEIRVISVQVVENSNFMYKGSYSPEVDFIEFLDKQKYFEVMKKCCKFIFEDGYYGDICIDSMVLNNGEIVPIVEINARKSMSLLKHYLDIYLDKNRKKGNFKYISFGARTLVNFEILLKKLKDLSLLYDGEQGVMPLSANTLDVNWEHGAHAYKGRFFYSVVSNDINYTLDVEQRLINSFFDIGISKIVL